MRDESVIEAPAVQDTLTARYTDEAVKFITEHKAGPFFLYLPHTAVHVPLHPGANFRGKSNNGRYGDWVEELDWSAGRILETVRELGLGSNTRARMAASPAPCAAAKARPGKVACASRLSRGGPGTSPPAPSARP
jgi:hypothetical protein